MGIIESSDCCQYLGKCLTHGGLGMDFNGHCGPSSKICDLQNFMIFRFSPTNSSTSRTRLASEAKKLCLKINNDKTRVLRANTSNEDPIQLEQERLEDIDSFTYLSSVVDQQGGS